MDPIIDGTSRPEVPSSVPPLRPPIPLPRRLNRNALTVAAALAGVTVLTVLVLTNPSKNRSSASPAGETATPTPAQPTFLDQPPKTVPVGAATPGTVLVPPPLPAPGDYGRSARVGPASRGAVVGAGRDRPYADKYSAARRQAYEAALVSRALLDSAMRAGANVALPVLSSTSPTPSWPQAIAQSEETPFHIAPVALHVDSIWQGGLSRETSDSSNRGDATSEGVASSLALHAGTVIPGSLITAINSDLPGTIVGQTSRDVFDSRTQQILLIPKGSKLIGGYDSHTVRSGRLIIEWNRLLFPDGRSITLPRSRGTDESGASGLHDQVDHHYPQIVGTALLLSAITAGVQLSQPQQATIYGTPSAGQVAAGALGQQMGQVGIESARRGLDLPPTITIRVGHPFDVLLTRDIAFDGPYVPAP
jgi:type IV secretory pathway VirB10-like protein